MDVKMARAMEVKAVKEVAAKVDSLIEAVGQLVTRLDRIESLLADLSAGRGNPSKQKGG